MLNYFKQLTLHLISIAIPGSKQFFIEGRKNIASLLLISFFLLVGTAVFMISYPSNWIFSWILLILVTLVVYAFNIFDLLHLLRYKNYAKNRSKLSEDGSSSSEEFL